MCNHGLKKFLSGAVGSISPLLIYSLLCSAFNLDGESWIGLFDISLVGRTAAVVESAFEGLGGEADLVDILSTEGEIFRFGVEANDRWDVTGVVVVVDNPNDEFNGGWGKPKCEATDG